MNDIQSFIDRQLGFHCRFNYDNILKRLVVNSEESFYGLQSSGLPDAFDQDPPIFACRFSEACGFENVLALANEDGRVAIQDTSTVRTAASLESFQCHNNAVFDLAWMPQNLNFVTVSGDHTASLWDVAEGPPKRVLMFHHHTKSVKTAVFRPNEPSVFATGARDGHILVWDTRVGGQPAVVLKPDNCLINCHSNFAPKTPGSHGKRPRIDTRRAVSITGLVFRDDATLVSCGECDGNIKLWDLRKNYNVYRREPLPKHSIPYCGSSARNGYTNLLVDGARTRLYASCMDNVIYCFNVAAYGTLPERRYVGHENATFYIKTGLSADDAYLVSGSSDKHAYVWNVKRSTPLVRLAGHRAEVTCAAWGPRTELVTCSDDARHMIWRVGPESPEREASGRAELVPRPDRVDSPQWGPLEDTPSSAKRKSATDRSHVKRPKREGGVRGTKRCLAELLNAAAAAEEGGAAAKRPRPAAPPSPLLPAGTKRPRGPEGAERHRLGADANAPGEWSAAPRAGASYSTPTKNYERKTCEPLSPRSPNSPSPVRVSPAKVRVITFTTPTKNLPNFVLDGEAPHHRLMSPVKKKRDGADWLTLMLREKRSTVEKSTVAVPLSPKENVPPRRNSVTEKTPKASNKSRTLLNYFSVTTKKNLKRVGVRTHRILETTDSESNDAEQPHTE